MTKALRIVGLMTCLLIAIVLTGCGSNKSTAPSVTSHKPTTTKTTTTASSVTTTTGTSRATRSPTPDPQTKPNPGNTGKVSKPAYQIMKKVSLWSAVIAHSRLSKVELLATVDANKCQHLSNSHQADIVLQEQECYDTFSEIGLNSSVSYCALKALPCLVTVSKQEIAAFSNLMADNLEATQIDKLSGACYNQNFAPEPKSKQYITAFLNLENAGETGKELVIQPAYQQWEAASKIFSKAQHHSPQQYMSCNPR
jgi:hypothetical protein